MLRYSTIHIHGSLGLVHVHICMAVVAQTCIYTSYRTCALYLYCVCGLVIYAWYGPISSWKLRKRCLKLLDKVLHDMVYEIMLSVGHTLCFIVWPYIYSNILVFRVLWPMRVYMSACLYIFGAYTSCTPQLG